MKADSATAAAARTLMWRLSGLVLAAGAAAALVCGPAGSAQARTDASTQARTDASTQARTDASTQAGTSSQPAFYQVSCTSGSFCLAAGYYSRPGRPDISLFEEWNGKKWLIRPLPPRSADALTCGSPSFCLATVLVPHKPSPRVVVVEWNGRAWQHFAPQPPPGSGLITCLSPAFCYTAGEAEWNGRLWQYMPHDSGGCGGPWCTISYLSCASATICFDAGTYCTDDNCDSEVSFSDTWNGTAWNTGGGTTSGGSEACAGRSFCMILNQPVRAHVSHDWGFHWHDATANLAAVCHGVAACRSDEDLACGSPWSCLALIPFQASEPTTTLAWNNGTWRIARLARAAGHLPKLTALSCGGPRNCVAVGSYQLTPSSPARPVAEHWNGKTWQITPMPSP
jgi:hypothetical protein